MRFDIDTYTKVIKIYDFNPIDGREVLIYSKQFELGFTFHSTIQYLFSKSTSELRTEIRELNSKVKSKLKTYLRDRGVAQDELYSRTGYNFEDVKLYTDYEEVKRLLD